MTQPENPFKPPTAEVADPVIATPNRPLAVRVACQLLLAAVALGFVTLIPGLRVEPPDQEEVSLLVTVITTGVLLGVILLLIAKIYQGRNWARWTNLALLVLSWLLTVEDVLKNFQVQPLASSIDVVVAVLELLATWLLFTGIGNYWFREMSRARREAR